ncbi:MAG: hypothetical protein AAF958_11060, partial [Planctomycetota bacterium]
KLFGKIPKYERTFLNSRSLPSLPNSDSVRQARTGLGWTGLGWANDRGFAPKENRAGASPRDPMGTAGFVATVRRTKSSRAKLGTGRLRLGVAFPDESQFQTFRKS